MLSGAETKRLLALAEEAAQQPWNERYGCPDCVDQGAWPLEIETTRGAKKTSTLDPQAVPPFLKALTEALTAVIERHPRAPQVALCTASDRSASGVQVSDVHVEKDELRLAVAFGGGCEPHAFRLCWDGAFLESLPGQARLRLMHDARPDSCEALLRRDLAFDLGPVRRAYEAQYPGDRAKIIGLSIEGQPGSGARYEF